MDHLSSNRTFLGVDVDVAVAYVLHKSVSLVQPPEQNLRNSSSVSCSPPALPSVSHKIENLDYVVEQTAKEV